MASVAPFAAPKVLSFVARTARDRGDLALERAVGLLEIAARLRLDDTDMDAVANAVAEAVSEAQVAVGAYRQAAEARS